MTPPILTTTKATLERVIAEDGWIQWNGGERPLPEMQVVEAQLRDGTVIAPALAGSLIWQHDDLWNDIMAYREVKP